MSLLASVSVIKALSYLHSVIHLRFKKIFSVFAMNCPTCLHFMSKSETTGNSIVKRKCDLGEMIIRFEIQ